MQTTAFGNDAEIVLHHLQQRPQRKIAHMHFQLARFHARDIQQAVQNAVLRGQRAFNAVGHMAASIVMQMVAQQRAEHARRIQRLQQVMHSGGDKAGFAAVGALGFALGMGQVLRAFGNAQFQRIGQTAQLAGRIFVAGDIGIAGDKTAIGQRIAANLQHCAVALGAFVQVRFAAAQVLQAPLNRFFTPGFAEQATAGVVANQGLNRLADPHQLGRIAKQLHITRIPGHQAQLGINHHHALGQVLQAA